MNEWEWEWGIATRQFVLVVFVERSCKKCTTTTYGFEKKNLRGEISNLSLLFF